VRLSALGISRILPEIIKGRLKHGLRRRSCHNRKLTDMSVGEVVSVTGEDHVRVKWSGMATEQVISRAFLVRISKRRLR
jgi:hypothetical protein